MICRCNYKQRKQIYDRSNNQPAQFTGKKKTTNLHLEADDSEVLEMTPREDIA